MLVALITTIVMVPPAVAVAVAVAVLMLVLVLVAVITTIGMVVALAVRQGLGVVREPTKASNVVEVLLVMWVYECLPSLCLRSSTLREIL